MKGPDKKVFRNFFKPENGYDRLEWLQVMGFEETLAIVSAASTYSRKRPLKNDYYSWFRTMKSREE